MDKHANLRVVFLWDSIRHLGGVTTFLKGLLETLPSHGIDPVVLEIGREKVTPPNWRPNREWSVVRRYCKPWDPPRLYHRSVIRTLVKARPNLVVTNNQIGLDYVPTIVGNLPIINILHSDFPHDSRYSVIWDAISRNAEHLSALVGVSESITGRLMETSGSPAKLHHIPYGVEIPSPRRRELTTIKILIVGRLFQEQKRIRDLVPFVQQLARARGDFTVTVIGDGPESGYLKQALSQYGNRVVFKGALTPDQMPEYYRDSHYLVMFSEYEGLSIAMLEAMSHGVVPIVTDIPSGVRQAIDDRVDGYLYPVGEPGQAASLIVESASSWESTSRAAAGKIAAEHSVDRMTKRYVDLFRRLAGSPLTSIPALVDEPYSRRRALIARSVVPNCIYTRVIGGGI